MRLDGVDVRIRALVNGQVKDTILLEAIPEIAIPAFGKERIFMVIRPVEKHGHKFLDKTLLFYQLVKALSEHQSQEFTGTISGIISIYGAKKPFFLNQPENTIPTWPSLVIESGSLTINGVCQDTALASI